MKDLGKRLSSLCEKKGLTLSGLARESGVPKATVHSWVTGNSPNISQLQKVANCLEVSLHFLAFGQPDPHEKATREILKEIFSGDIRVTLHKIERGNKPF